MAWLRQSQPCPHATASANSNSLLRLRESITHHAQDIVALAQCVKDAGEGANRVFAGINDIAGGIESQEEAVNSIAQSVTVAAEATGRASETLQETMNAVQKARAVTN